MNEVFDVDQEECMLQKLVIVAMGVLRGGWRPRKEHECNEDVESGRHGRGRLNMFSELSHARQPLRERFDKACIDTELAR
jgi:hypothetical protein